jgi:phage shock protein PspC (stress-responsive transcriptional regulator)
MKRTITMNLSGIIFHIEEDAYEKLSNYLNTIKGYFKNSQGCDEIMSDIEARIAEMLQSKVSGSKQAVVMADVEHVISVMGGPEAFADEASNNSDSKGQKNKEENTFTYNGRRRVFRDPDDKVIGGVCSGIANHFDFDPIWLRAAFAISFFVFGSGFLIYLVLMIIIPKARTVAEKLEMRGERVDVNNIGKAVNDEFQEFKKKMNDLGKEVNSDENRTKIKTSGQKFADFLSDLLHRVFKAVGKAAAFFLIFVAVVLMIGLLATLFGTGTINVFDAGHENIRFSLYEFCNAVLPNDLEVQYVVIALLLFIGVPLLSMIYGGVRYLFGIKHKNKIVKYTANVLWLVGLALVVFIGIKTGSDFTEQAATKQVITLAQPLGNTLYLDLNETISSNHSWCDDEDCEDDEECEHTHHSRHGNFHVGRWMIASKDKNHFKLGHTRLDIVQSKSDSFELVATKKAHGFDKDEAISRARAIEYSINQSDSLITFNNSFDVLLKDKIRAQELKLTLKVPVGKTIFLSEKMDGIIYNVRNVTKTLDSDMVNRKWIMTTTGLTCVDCDGLEKE